MAPKDPTWTPLPTTPPPLPRPPRTANTRPSRPLQWATMVGLCNDPAPSTGCLTWYGIRSASRLHCHHRISNYCPVFYQNIYSRYVHHFVAPRVSFQKSGLQTLSKYFQTPKLPSFNPYPRLSFLPSCPEPFPYSNSCAYYLFLAKHCQSRRRYRYL